MRGFFAFYLFIVCAIVALVLVGSNLGWWLPVNDPNLRN